MGEDFPPANSEDRGTNALSWRETFDEEPSEFGSAGETPDWLKAAESEITDSPPPQSLSDQPEETGAVEQPDWLKDFEKQTPADSSKNAADSPDWLNAFEQDVPTEQPDEKQEAAEWLESFKEESLSLPKENSITASQTPDWLKDVEEDIPTEQSAKEQPLDWLAAYEDDAVSPFQPNRRPRLKQ